MSPFPDDPLIEDISNFLNKEHHNHYIVYNLSEHKYDNSFFNNSVILKAFTILLGNGIFFPWFALSTFRCYFYDMFIYSFMVKHRSTKCDSITLLRHKSINK